MYVFIPSEFVLQDLVNEIKNAKEKIIIESMVIEFGDKTKKLEEELINAKRRGVEVILEIDWFSRMTTDKYTNYFPKNPKEITRYKYYKENNNKILKRLKEEGIKIRYINKAFPLIGEIFYVVGRNHIKLILIDNTAYIGGVNIQERFFDFADFYLKTTNQKIVNVLNKQILKVDKEEPLTDLEISIDDENTIYVDHGGYFESIIYKQAIELIKNTKFKLNYISQLVPDWELLKELNNARKRGVDVNVINHHSYKSSAKLSTKAQHFFYFLKENELTTYLYPDKYIHAKLIISDDKCVFFGSHNFSKYGIMFGTNEIALKSTNEYTVKSMIEWFEVIKEHSDLIDNKYKGYIPEILQN